jgi:hypothetical protein
MKTRKAKVKANKPADIEQPVKSSPVTQRYQAFVARSRLEIDPQLMADLRHDGWELVWVAESVNGAGMPSVSDAVEARKSNGFSYLRCDDFDGLFARYCETDGPADRPVRYGGLVLMIVDRNVARACELAEKAAAAEAIAGTERYKIHGVPGTMGGTHPSALANNKIERSFERIKVPD